VSDRSHPLVVRPVREGELVTVGELTVRAYVEGGGLPAQDDYLPQLSRARDRAAASPLLVAVRDGVLVGAVSLCPFASAWAQIARPGELELRMLVVDPTAFGTGVADALIDASVEHARIHDLGQVVLCVISTNAPAHRLYRRYGLTRAPERDWSPVPGVVLQAYVLPVSRTAGG
jgi:ribosomal protein S18 acetylase RimI-like enzyme